LQRALAAALQIRGLRIAYWLPGRQRYVDTSGQVVPEPSATAGRSGTRLTRNERAIAAVSHSGEVPGAESQIGPAIGLGPDNECPQAVLASSRNPAPPVPASSRPPTPNAAGWSGTCTTAPSSGCWPPRAVTSALDPVTCAAAWC
jgi:hypothetical protein